MSGDHANELSDEAKTRFTIFVVLSVITIGGFGSYCYIWLKQERNELQRRLVERQHRTQGLVTSGSEENQLTDNEEVEMQDLDLGGGGNRGT